MTPVVLVEGNHRKMRCQTRPLDGHPETRTVEGAIAQDLIARDRDPAKANERGIAELMLTGSVVRHEEPEGATLAVMSTRVGLEAGQPDEADRLRWGIETAGFPELKEGWLVERSPGGRAAAIVRGRMGIPLFAQQVVVLSCQAAGRQLAGDGMRRLRRALNLALGGPGMVVVIDECDAVLPVEELIEALGNPVTQSLRRPVADMLRDARRRA